ncbi:NAD(P)-dependent oxidoreductase [Pseudonocardia pini]|uniref:NAD(P)-dependent oxidoreductase n=1 Tax=Pseudonocardia pini TaxID=2758030 RepID=UPI0015F081A6|nr:NAD(P)-dependent oxidoreductase [Pseudonocardia pini]
MSDARTSDGLVGLVGLGNMGAAVAERLAPAHRLVAYDLDASRRAAARAGGVGVVDDLAGLADARLVVLSLPKPEASTAVVGRLAEVLAEGSLVVETSTVNPHDVRRLAETARSAGLRTVDAAILSGVAAMRSGDATLLTGGEEADLAAAEPVLTTMSRRRLHFGRLGSGMAAKVVNNAVAHSVMVVLAEALALAGTNGIESAALVELLKDPEAGLMRPLTHRVAERVARADFAGGMPTEAARKDSALALELAGASGVPLFGIQATHTVYELAVAAGLGRDDYASIATLWQRWDNAGHGTAREGGQR